MEWYFIVNEAKSRRVLLRYGCESTDGKECSLSEEGNEGEREREREGEKVISCILHRLATTNEGSKQASKEMKM